MLISEVLPLRNPPLVRNLYLTRGGFLKILIWDQKISPAAGPKNLIFGRFRPK